MSDIQKNKKYFKKEDLMKRLDWLAANAEIHNDLLVQAIALDSIAWMKEQEAKTVESIQMDRSEKWGADLTGYCPSCKRPLRSRFSKQFCGECGQAVKWE